MIARDGELDLAPLATGHSHEAWAVSASPASPALLFCPHAVSQGSSFWYLLGVKSCESGKKLVKNRLTCGQGRLGKPIWAVALCSPGLVWALWGGAACLLAFSGCGSTWESEARKHT